MRQKGRLPALDALRGVLALVVVADHEAIALGSHALDVAAGVSVWGFFAMSAFVLSRAWDGRYGAFLLRRAVRLAPVYLAAWAAGCLLLGPGTPYEVDAPTWSLGVEAMAMLAFPVLLWAGATIRRALWTITGLIALMLVDARAIWAAWFVVGVVAHQTLFDDWQSPLWLTSAPLLWLGTISYSLYLTHWIVLEALGPWGILAVPPVAWATWRWVERPSVRWSRRVGQPGPHARIDARSPLHIAARHQP